MTAFQRLLIPVLNVLSVDVEDYFQVEAFAADISPSQWHTYPLRVEHNVGQILDLFSKYDVKATFFILGWAAERIPALVREIQAAGHEIGCHGYSHRNIQRQIPTHFREDIRRARECLEQQAQQAVISYRAPSFSIVNKTKWALDILAEEGFKYDSSIFPVRHDVYGIPDAPRFPHWYTADTKTLFEFPPSTIRKGSVNIGIGGGGYLRFAPYCLTKWGLQQINKIENQPAMVYFHPWELDPEQPRIPSSLRSRLRHYSRLSSMKHKIEKLLTDFRFHTLSHVCEQLDSYRSGINPP